MIFLTEFEICWNIFKSKEDNEIWREFHIILQNMYAKRDVVNFVRVWNCLLKRISATKCLLCDIKRGLRILKENKLGFLSVPHSHRHVLWSSHRTYDIHNCCETLSYTNVKTCSINQDLLQKGFEHPTFSMQNEFFCSLHYFGKI